MSISFEKIMSLPKAINRLGRLPKSALILSVAALVGFFIFWVIDRLFLLATSRSYIDQIARAFDLNRHLAEAMSLMLFALLAVSLSFLFSLSRRRRLIGLSAVLSLLVINSLALWLGTRSQFFEASGVATKCYVMTRQGVRFGEHSGIDLQTGKPCRPVTADLMDRLTAYSQGKRPERVTTDDPIFFDLKTGEPNLWFAKDQSGAIQLFDTMGYHPDTGEELQPITKTLVQEWRVQELKVAERAPSKIEDPKTYMFFDPKSGASRAWYWTDSDGQYEFYDNKGFQPRTGESLKVVTRETLREWEAKTASKCYIVTRQSIVFGSKIGLDPQTGRECRVFTPALLERLKDYEKGARPKRIMAPDIAFFDLRTGEPNVWYSHDDKGRIKLFDLIGFDPDTGQELLPVTTEVVSAWKSQLDIKHQKPPSLVDPTEYPFFNTVSGEPQVWFWHDAKGEWEFYDNAGFRQTGEKLNLISQDTIEAWRHDVAEKVRVAAEQEAQAERMRVAAEDTARRAREAEAMRQVSLQRQQEAQADEERKSGEQCDRIAANPSDTQKPSDLVGVEYADLKVDAQSAIDICSKAVKVNPQELRYRYNLARALEFTKPQQAINIDFELIKQHYIAAYDNLGGLILRERKDLKGAIKQYEAGWKLGDPSAMFSLAYLIKHNQYSVQDPDGVRHALLVRAAAGGHAGARDTLTKEQGEIQARAYQQQTEQAQQKMMLDLFSGVVRGLAR